MLVVGADADPPIVHDPLEDWVREGTPEPDVVARLEMLAWRAGTRTTPEITMDGTLSHRGKSVQLGRIHADMATLLVARFGSIVPRAHVALAAWPDEPPRPNTIDVQIHRLRRRLSEVHLALISVRSRGLMITNRPAQRDVRSVSGTVASA